MKACEKKQTNDSGRSLFNRHLVSLQDMASQQDLRLFQTQASVVEALSGGEIPSLSSSLPGIRGRGPSRRKEGKRRAHFSSLPSFPSSFVLPAYPYAQRSTFQPPALQLSPPQMKSILMRYCESKLINRPLEQLAVKLSLVEHDLRYIRKNASSKGEQVMPGLEAVYIRSLIVFCFATQS